MDVFRWNWTMHAVIWGLTILTLCCVIAIDSSPTMPGYRATLHTLGSKTVLASTTIDYHIGFPSRVLVKTYSEYFRPSDIRIARKIEKFGNPNEVRSQVSENLSTDHHQ
ncbi:putative P-type phospholipid transporter [Dioscorea sansibarensis]